MTATNRKTVVLKTEWEELGRSLQAELEDAAKSLEHMGRTIAEATTERLTEAADETLGAAEKALLRARKRVTMARRQLRQPKPRARTLHSA